MGRMSNLYFVVMMSTAFCSGCPAQQQADSRPLQYEPSNLVAAPVSEPMPAPSAEPEDDGIMRMCVLPAAVEIDGTLPEIADVVAEYWTEQGYAMLNVEPGDGCTIVLDVSDEALAKDGWGFKEAQTWIPNTITETNPVLVRFRAGFWVDPMSSQELKAALAAHEIGHVFLGAQHEPEATGKLMSPIVTEDLAQELFGGRF